MSESIPSAYSEALAQIDRLNQELGGQILAVLAQHGLMPQSLPLPYQVLLDAIDEAAAHAAREGLNRMGKQG